MQNVNSRRKIEDAAKKGDLNELIRLHQAGETLCRFTIENAINYGHVDCLRYCHENGSELYSYYTHCACANGKLEVLKYLIENGCGWDDFAASTAAINGHFECLKFAHENGAYWDSNTTKNAGFGGYLDCLQYAHKNGCEWHPETTFEIAWSSRNIECLKYAVQNNCILDPDTVKGIFYKMYLCEEAKQIECFEYCFSVCKDPSTFWDDEFNHIIPQLDFTKSEWRPLFSIDLSSNPELKEAVDKAKIYIVKTQNVLKISLKNTVTENLLKHVIFNFI